MQKTAQHTHYRKVCKEKKHAAFSFSEVSKEEIFREILNLDVSKACQDRYSFQNNYGERGHSCQLFTL